MRVQFMQDLIDLLRGKNENLLYMYLSYKNYKVAIKSYKDIPQYKIIFKFDDLVNCDKKVQELDKFIKKENIKVCWSIIGISLENAQSDYINFIKNNYGKNYSFFNHGYLHLGGSEYEFQNKSTAEQVESIKKTQDIVFEKTGIKLNAFGAPCNHIDNNTKTALENIPEIKYWFYGFDGFSGYNLKRTINMENGVGNPNFNYFIKNLLKSPKSAELVTLQGHPYMWDVEQKVNFYFIIKFLKKVGCKFIFPEELEVKND